MTEQAAENKEVDQPASNEPSAEVIAKAQEMGWVPEEEWKGGGKWRPAGEYVERGEKIMPIVQSKLKKVEKELEMLIKSSELSAKKAAEEGYNRAKSEYDAKMKELDEKEMEAFSTADAETFQKVKEEKAKLEPPKKEEPPQVTQNQVFVEWSEKNPWYSEKDELREFADFHASKVVESNPTIANAELYKLVEEKVKATFKHEFTNPNRESAPSVEGGNDAPTKSKGGFASLPDSAKATYASLEKKFAAQGKKYTKEEYTEAYYE